MNHSCPSPGRNERFRPRAMNFEITYVLCVAVGAFILFGLPEFLEHMARLELALEGLIFMLILIFLPGGIVGGLNKMLKSLRFFR